MGGEEPHFLLANPMCLNRYEKLAWNATWVFSFEVVLLIPQFPGEKRQLFVVAVTMYIYVAHKDKSESNKVCLLLILAFTSQSTLKYVKCNHCHSWFDTYYLQSYIKDDFGIYVSFMAHS